MFHCIRITTLLSVRILRVLRSLAHSPCKPGAAYRGPAPQHARVYREFRDVVFEDVVFDHNSSVTPLV